MCRESPQLVNKISLFHLPLKLTLLYHPNIWTQVPKSEGKSSLTPFSLYHEFKIGRKFSQNILNQVSTGKEIHHGPWLVSSVSSQSLSHPGVDGTMVLHWSPRANLPLPLAPCWELGVLVTIPAPTSISRAIFAKLFPRPPKPLQAAVAILSHGHHFTPRPNLPVIPGISWLPTFAFISCDEKDILWC